jgi:dCTP deaminase
LVGEEVLCLENGKSVYQPVQDFHRYYFNGDLLSFQSKFVSQIVTPRHKMWAAISKRRVMSDCVYPSGRTASVNRKASMVYPFERIEAEKIFGKHNVYLLREVDWVGSRHEDEIRFGNRCYPISTWLKFLGCWLGDGSAFIQGGGNYVIKLAVVTKEKKREYFRSVLDEMGVNYHEAKYGFEFRHKATCLYLMQYKGAKNKRVPREYMSLPPDQLSLIRDGLMHSDGNLETSTFCSTSKQLIDDFQELSIKIGDYATVWIRNSKIRGESINTFVCRYSSRGSTPSKVLPENCQKIPYSGFVYDLTVPSHVFLVRHNGRASWTGNSWQGHLTIEISNASPADTRIYANEGICQAVFFEGQPCETPYGSDRKDQNQGAEVVLPSV